MPPLVFLYWKEVGQGTHRQSPSMNAPASGAVSICMTTPPNPNLTPKEREIHTLFARGKSPETIAIRMGMKISKVLTIIAMVR